LSNGIAIIHVLRIGGLARPAIVRKLSLIAEPRSGILGKVPEHRLLEATAAGVNKKPVEPSPHLSFRTLSNRGEPLRYPSVASLLRRRRGMERWSASIASTTPALTAIEVNKAGKQSIAPRRAARKDVAKQE
jgi:hypothetical protein